MALIDYREYLVFGRVRRESDERTKINSSTTKEGLISADNGECDKGGDADQRREKSPPLERCRGPSLLANTNEGRC